MSKPTPLWLVIVAYGGLVGLVLICLMVLQHSYVIWDLGVEVYAGTAGLLFLLVGIGLGRKLWYRIHPRPQATNNATPLSHREIDVLQAASWGLSNQEIAEKLFISLSTVKSHLSSIYSKLGVKRRTQAIDLGRQLKIIE